MPTPQWTYLDTCMLNPDFSTLWTASIKNEIFRYNGNLRFIMIYGVGTSKDTCSNLTNGVS